MDKANCLKKNYLGIILFLRTNFDNVLPVSFGEEWIYKIIWNYLTKQFMIIATSKSLQIPQVVTYGENLVKDNSIAPSAKR